MWLFCWGSIHGRAHFSRKVGHGLAIYWLHLIEVSKENNKQVLEIC